MKTSEDQRNRVLVGTSIPLHPPGHGNRARNLALVRALRSAGFSVHYLHWIPIEEVAVDRAVMLRLVDRFESVAARPGRWSRLIARTGRNLGFMGRRVLPYWAWHLLCANRDSNSMCPKSVLARADQMLSEGGFTAVIASYSNFAPMAELARRHGVPAIIDTHDILCERAASVHAELVPPSGVIISEKQEATLLGKADLVLAIQRREAEWVADRIGKDRTMLVEHGFDMPAATSFPAANCNRLTLIASDNPQNHHGLEWFLSKVWPLVLGQRPSAELHVYGPLSKRPVCSGPKVFAHGVVDRLDPVYRDAAILINPIRAGSGLKIKTVEAMAHARAIVTTSVGADGLLPEGAECLSVADDPTDFAASVVRFMDSPESAAEYGQRARSLCEGRFSNESVYAPLIDWIRARSKAVPTDQSERTTSNRTIMA
jgi:polysaccharide biosynthesis protein PslH